MTHLWFLVQSSKSGIYFQVVRNLQQLYGDVYSLRNVILTGTHTHSAPGGHLVDFLLDISILGFSVETYDAYVAGITRVRREGTAQRFAYCLTHWLWWLTSLHHRLHAGVRWGAVGSCGLTNLPKECRDVLETFYFTSLCIYALRESLGWHHFVSDCIK